MWVYPKFLQNVQRVIFFTPNLYFFIEKEYVIEKYVLERTQGSINSCET